MIPIDDFNEEFRKSAAGFSLVPSQDAWKTISADILHRKRKKRLLIFFLFTAALLFGILALRKEQTGITEKNSPVILQQHPQEVTVHKTENGVRNEMNHQHYASTLS